MTDGGDELKMLNLVIVEWSLHASAACGRQHFTYFMIYNVPYIIIIIIIIWYGEKKQRGLCVLLTPSHF